MISNIGIEAVATSRKPTRTAPINLWSSIDTVTNGLGGGNELVGGIWVLLVSIAGLLTARLPPAQRRRRHHRRRRSRHCHPGVRDHRDGLRTRIDHLVRRHRHRTHQKPRPERSNVMTITTTPQAEHTTRGHQAVRIPAVGATGICMASSGYRSRWQQAHPPANTSGAAAKTEFCQPTIAHNPTTREGADRSAYRHP